MAVRTPPKQGLGDDRFLVPSGRVCRQETPHGRSGGARTRNRVPEEGREVSGGAEGIAPSLEWATVDTSTL